MPLNNTNYTNSTETNTVVEKKMSVQFFGQISLKIC